MLNSLDSTLTFPISEGRTGQHRHWGGGETGISRRGVRRLSRTLLCAESVPGPPPLTKDNTAPFGGCLLTSRDPSIAEAEAVPGTSSAMTMSNGGGGGSHESE